jgi:hypothetical protein
MRAELATKDDLESVRAEVLGVRSKSLTSNQACTHVALTSPAALLTTRKEPGEQIVGLRRAVINCHPSAATA